MLFQLQLLWFLHTETVQTGVEKCLFFIILNIFFALSSYYNFSALIKQKIMVWFPLEAGNAQMSASLVENWKSYAKKETIPYAQKYEGVGGKDAISNV